ncbi:MAG TPA: alpha/beta hydrolase-fold protein, partial [Candidatus Angelobacter sp.]|nr:alpha/beta hydrolase-fold protein [Candidatus Angelobacter sp.]
VPAGHDKARRYPLLVDLVGFTGSGQSHTNWRPFTENLPERLDRLIGEGGMPPVVVAFPDCFSRLGGNQYINSAAIGRYEDYLVDEVVPLVERELGCGGPGRRGVFGKSSGGYGAIVHGMRRPDVWSALACHSGDMAFEVCYLQDMPVALNELAKHDRSIENFMHAFEQTTKPKEKEITTINALAMAASYDPDPTQFLGIRLPVDLETCELMPERWRNWLAHDPVRMADACADNLRRLKAIYIDCGNEDQFHLHYGARQLNHALTRLGIAHTYEEFPDNHSDIDYRMDISLPFLARALA